MEFLRDLLAEEGSIWIVIDDNEGHYLRVRKLLTSREFAILAIWR
jgi:adenine-specific DNA-methyltransferase